MFDSENQSNSKATLLHSLALKLLSLVYLYLTLAHWAALIGFTGEGFIDMPMTERIYHLGMGVFAPVLAFGLWAPAGWAVALWGVLSLVALVLAEATPLEISFNLHLGMFGLFILYLSLRLIQRRLA